LNIGVEELKGNDTVKAAGQILRNAELPMEFFGFVEGDGIASGVVDVIVTDGFTGNVALKTAEGTARLFGNYLEGAFKRSLFSRLGYLLARPAIEAFHERVDPRHYDGAMLLGLNGIAVKSHGGTDETGFASAIGVAVDMVSENICAKIVVDFEQFGADRESEAQAAAS
jgi:glycerol-3-phosphate acyltransferase PlsX